LLINSLYLETAGNNKRSSTLGDKMRIAQDYLYESIVVFRDVLTFFKEQLEIKYRTYTHINAVIKLFDIPIFDTPIMKDLTTNLPAMKMKIKS
jgi:hypothetical protein